MKTSKQNERYSGPVFELPPDSVPDERLLRSVEHYVESGKPLLFLARMRRVPYGFILHIKTAYVDAK